MCASERARDCARSQKFEAGDGKHNERWEAEQGEMGSRWIRTRDGGSEREGGRRRATTGESKGKGEQETKPRFFAREVMGRGKAGRGGGSECEKRGMEKREDKREKGRKGVGDHRKRGREGDMKDGGVHVLLRLMEDGRDHRKRCLRRSSYQLLPQQRCSWEMQRKSRGCVRVDTQTVLNGHVGWCKKPYHLSMACREIDGM